MAYRDCDELCTQSCPEFDNCPERNLQVEGDSRTFYVYVANRLSGDPGQYLANLREMSAMSRALMEAGFVPLTPGGDFLEGLVSPEPMPVSAYQRRALDLLRLLAGRRAALLVVNAAHRNGRRSEGVHVEISTAMELGIPVAYSIEELAQLRGTEG
jgi:hypothetical protein